jgi:DNA primase
MLDRELVQEEGLILVEGSLDTIKMHQMGFRNTVGILGTGLSGKQVRIIYDIDPPRIYDFFDKDSAGADNVQASRERVTKIPIFVMLYPKHRSDPAEMTRMEVERAIERALPIGEFFRRARKVNIKEAIRG